MPWLPKKAPPRRRRAGHSLPCVRSRYVYGRQLPFSPREFGEKGRGPRRRRKVSPSKLKASLESRRKPRESKGGRARGTERGKACCTRVREKGILYLQLCSLSGHIFPGTAFQQSRSFPRNRVSSHRPSSLSALLGLISARSAPFPPVAPATLLSPRILLQWCGSVAVTAVVVFSYARTRNRRLLLRCRRMEGGQRDDSLQSTRPLFQRHQHQVPGLPLL